MGLLLLGKEMNMKIYVVCTGEYSDRGVSAVFTNRDNAYAYMSAVDGDIDEFDADPDLNAEEQKHLRPGLRPFRVKMDADGNNARAELESLQVKPEMSIRIGANGELESFVGYCWAPDEQHAIKIVNERRSGWLASPRLLRPERYGWHDTR